MRQKFILIATCAITLATAFCSCNTSQSKKGKATFTAKNLVAVDSFYLGGMAFAAGSVKIEVTLADSLDKIVKELNTKTPVTETFAYDVAPGDVMTVNVIAAGKNNLYFLEGGDNVEAIFNNKGVVEKSTFNGDSSHTALIYNQSILPDYAVESFLHSMKDPEGRHQHVFDSAFQIENDAAVQQLKTQIDKAFADKKITETMHYALLKNMEYHSRTLWWYAGKDDVAWNDKSMGIALYRMMPDIVIENKKLLTVSENGVDPAQLTAAFDKTLADTSFQPKSRYMMLRTWLNYMGKFAPELIKPAIAKIPDEQIRKQYDALFTKEYMLDIDKYRADAANINLVDYDRGKGVTTFSQLMEKNKGKVVYVDFWASWCGPCRGEMPASHKLSEELKGQPIEFVYLSTDAAYTDWAKAAEQEGFVGNDNSKLIVNTVASSQFKSWKIDGIPRYMIFDKTGKLVNEDAPRPSDKGTKELLLKLAK